MIKISPFTPLFFSPTTDIYGVDSRYVQVFSTSDSIFIQVLTDGGEKVTGTLDNAVTGTSRSLSFEIIEMSSNVIAHTAVIENLTEGYYSVDVCGNRSDIFRVTASEAELEGTSLITYTSSTNKLRSDVVFWNDTAQYVFQFRVHGGFKDGDWAFEVTNEQFETGDGNIVELYAVESTKKTFTMGNSLGCPIWFGDFLNRLLCCTHVHINGARYVRKGNSSPELTQEISDQKSYIFKVALQGMAENLNIELPASDDDEPESEGGGTGYVYLIKLNDTTRATDANTFSALRILYEINKAVEGNREELLKMFLRKDKDDRSVGTIASDKGFEAGNFVPEATGAACWKDGQGNWHIETDHLRVRKKAVFTEIEVQEVHHVGGQMMLTAANMIVDYVYEMIDRYRCYYRKVDGDGREVENLWQTGDQAYCNTFNLTKQDDGTLGNHYLWRLVIGTNLDTYDNASKRTFGVDTINTADYNFVDLSKTDCASLSDAPLANDEIVSLGYQPDDDPNRQNAIIIAGAGSGSPYIYEFTGINSFTLPEPETRIKPGDNFFTGKFVSKATGLDFDEEFEKIRVDWDKVLEQTDKEFTMWFYDYDPTLENYPASDWVTDEYKALHDQDLFYNTATGIAYRFELIDGFYGWGVVTDLETIKALEKAAKAQDTADSKRRNFAAQPTPPYDIGDRWSNATYGELYSNDDLVCIVPKAEGESFSIDDWQPADCMDSGVKTQYETKFEQLDSSIELWANAHNELLGTVTSLGVRLDAAEENITIWASKTDENSSSIASLVIRADEISSTVASVQELAEAAQEAAEDAAADALDAWWLGYEAQQDAATAITQSNKAISILAVNFDDYGNVLSSSGLVTTANFSTLYATAVEADTNVVKRAELSTYVQKNSDGTLESGVTITADNIDLTAIDGSISFALTGYSFFYLNDPSYPGLIDIRNDEGTCIRVQGYGDDSVGLKITVQAGTGTSAITSSGNCSFAIRSGETFKVSSSGGMLNVCDEGVIVSGLLLGNINTSTSVYGSTDFIKATGAISLPSAAGCRGKVIFVKMKGDYAISSSSSIYKSDSNSTYSSESFNNRSLFFISDGSAWYEFTCYSR